VGTKQKVIVVGGGFAGLQFARNLDARLFDILLIDKVNHHQFQPLFYQVATSQLEPSSISFPLRHVFRKKMNIQIRLAEVTEVNTDKNEVHTSIGAFSYDQLVIALGCTTNYFGNKNLHKHTLSLKSTYDAIEIRNHILQTFERITWESEPEKEALLNIVIVGAGPTGVELAGAFAEIRNNILPKDYHRIDFTRLRIILVEGGRYTLPGMSKPSRNAAEKYLRKMGVEIIPETFVEDYDGETLKFSSGKTLKSKTVIWAAGVTGNQFKGLPNEVIAAGNRIKVDRLNRVLNLQNVFAVGDIAYMVTPKYPHGHPQLANVAINQAKNLARNLKRVMQQKQPRSYEYVDLGVMATIGTNKAVVEFPFVRFKGYFAWFIWMFLHLMLILSVKNKLIIFINWAWAYVTKNSALRLILTQKQKRL
jgi:NADH:ubiquinone reductase (H+-translocating)